MSHFGIPGIGGSLGTCAVCGESFAFEIIVGKNISYFKMEQFKDTLYAHEDCMNVLSKIKESGGNWHDLPDGPIKEGFARITKEEKEQPNEHKNNP